MEFTFLWAILKRRRWLIVQCVVIVTFLSYLFSVLREPMYTANATILLEDIATQTSLLRAIGLEEISSLLPSASVGGGREALSVEILKIRSKGVIEEVIKRMNLKDKHGHLIPIGTLRTPPSILRWNPQYGLKIQQVSRTNALQITCYSPKRDEVAAIVDTLIAVYKEQDVNTKHAETKSAAEFVQEQSIGAKAMWTKSRDELEAFQEQAQFVDLSQETQLLIQQIAQLRAQQELLQLSNQEIVNSDTGAFGGPTVSGVTFSQMSGILALRTRLADLETELKGKLTQWTDSHPQVVLLRKQIKELQEQIANEEGLYSASSQERLQGMRDQLTRYQKDLNRLPELLNRFSELTLSVNVYEDLYQMLTQMKYRLDISTAMQLSKVRIIEPPWKVSLYSPKVGRNTGLAFAVALILAVGLALFIEYLDDTIKDEDEVKDLYQLPVLGAIPLLARRETPLVTSERTTRSLLQLRETMNTLAYNIKLESLDKPVRQILITSSIPTEGKSSVATNLALTMARNGKKVLLVDADYPRASLRKMFNIENDRGLTEVLIGEVPLEQAIRQVGNDGCYLLTTGQRPANPLSLLDSQRMEDFIVSASQKFDILVFDTPPVLHHNATVALASKMDRVLFVISANLGSRKIIGKAIEILKTAKVRFLGVALNRVRAGEGYYYYYYYYYYSDEEGGKQTLWKRIRRVFKPSKRRKKRVRKPSSPESSI
jgi:capsular exopolysaccharide synthesis family protein